MKNRLIEIRSKFHELREAGAIRPDHHARAGAFDVMLEQAIDLAGEPAPVDPVDVRLTRIEAALELIDADVTKITDKLHTA
jgi:hypothetical protein